MIVRLFQLAFWSALIFAFVMASLPAPPALPGALDDKQLHVLAFAVLAGLAALAFPRIALLLLFFSLAVVGGSIELVQAIPSLGRNPSWLDWYADLAGAGVVLSLAGLLRKPQAGTAD